MIVTAQELEALERAIAAEEELWRKGDDNDVRAPGTRFLQRNAHLLLLLGYDEYRILRESQRNRQLVGAYVGGEFGAFPGRFESIYRTLESGE